MIHENFFKPVNINITENLKTKIVHRISEKIEHEGLLSITDEPEIILEPIIENDTSTVVEETTENTLAVIQQEIEEVANNLNENQNVYQPDMMMVAETLARFEEFLITNNIEGDTNVINHNQPLDVPNNNNQQIMDHNPF